MKQKMKNLMTITTIIVFSIIAVASTDDKSNENNDEVTYDPMTDADGGEIEGENVGYEYEQDLGDGWTLYHAYKPSQSTSDCNSKKCNWCNEIYYADDVDFEEYPSDVYEAIGNATGFGSKENIDMENKKIFSSWTVKCIYNYGDYCSRRCSEKY